MFVRLTLLFPLPTRVKPVYFFFQNNLIRVINSGSEKSLPVSLIIPSERYKSVTTSHINKFYILEILKRPDLYITYAILNLCRFLT